MHFERQKKACREFWARCYRLSSCASGSRQSLLIWPSCALIIFLPVDVWGDRMIVGRLSRIYSFSNWKRVFRISVHEQAYDMKVHCSCDVQSTYARRQLAFISKVTFSEFCKQKNFMRAALEKIQYFVANFVFVTVKFFFAIENTSAFFQTLF